MSDYKLVVLVGFVIIYAKITGPHTVIPFPKYPWTQFPTRGTIPPPRYHVDLVCDVKKLYRENYCNFCWCNGQGELINCTLMQCSGEAYSKAKNCDVGRHWKEECSDCVCNERYGTVCIVKDCNSQEACTCPKCPVCSKYDSSEEFLNVKSKKSKAAKGKKLITSETKDKTTRKNNKTKNKKPRCSRNQRYCRPYPLDSDIEPSESKEESESSQYSGPQEESDSTENSEYSESPEDTDSVEHSESSVSSDYGNGNNCPPCPKCPPCPQKEVCTFPPPDSYEYYDYTYGKKRGNVNKKGRTPKERTKTSNKTQTPK